jgi:hypothetical protein
MVACSTGRRPVPQLLAAAAPGEAERPRPLLRFWNRISYPAWQALAQALAVGPARDHGLGPGSKNRLCRIEAVLAGPANAPTAALDFAAHRRVLDVGRPGSWSMRDRAPSPSPRHVLGFRWSIARAMPEPETPTGSTSRRRRLRDRCRGTTTCSCRELVHYRHEPRPAAPDRAPPRGRRSAPGGWTNPTHTEPLHAALMAGEFAVHVRDGDVYSVDEVSAWLAETGWRFESHRPLAGPQSLIVATATDQAQR